MSVRAVAALAIAAIAAAAGFDAVERAQRTVPERVRVETTAGTLTCPAGSIGTGPAHVWLANIGSGPTFARLAIVADDGATVTVPVEIPPSATRAVRVDDKVTGGAAVFIDHAGGRLLASHTLWPRGRGAPPGVAAGACSPATDARTVLVGGVTRATQTRLIIANPGGANADVTVTLQVDGERVSPESLTKRVIPPRSRRVFRLGDFVFDGADITAIVDATSGRVVAEASIEATSGIAIIGGAAAGEGSLQIVGASTGPRAVSFAAIEGEEEAALDVRLLAEDEQGKAPDVPATLGFAGSARVAVPSRSGTGPAGYVVNSVGAPVATASSWLRAFRGRGNERAAVEGLAPALRWGAVLGSPSPPVDVRAIIANPTDRPAQVRLVSLVGEEVSERDIVVPAGRVLSHLLGQGRNIYAAFIRSDVEVTMALEGLSGSVPAAFMIPGVQVGVADAVAVRRDPRVGVPAPMP